jgi:hypothetical protein
MQHHKYSLTELENMMPWERDIYISLLIQYIEEENQKIKERQKKRRKLRYTSTLPLHYVQSESESHSESVPTSELET